MKKRAAYSTMNKISALALICTLLWLTVSLPFMYRSQLAEQHKAAASVPYAGSEEDSSNPLSGTEEKAPSTTNLAEEFLHEQEKADCPVTNISADHYHQNDGTYQAFHGELLVPPPNVA